MRDVLLVAQATGLLSGETVAEASLLMYGLHEKLEQRRADDVAEQAFDDASWRAAADALLEQSTEADVRARRTRTAARRATKPDWGLDRPRRAQHPATTEWRRECEKRGLPTLTAGQEERLGLGVRGARIEDEPPLLTPDHPAWKAALRRIEAELFATHPGRWGPQPPAHTDPPWWAMLLWCRRRRALPRQRGADRQPLCPAVGAARLP